MQSNFKSRCNFGANINPYLSASAMAPLDVVALPRHDAHTTFGLFSNNLSNDQVDGPLFKKIQGAVHD